MPASIDVLVVDEDPDILDLTETFLERADDDLVVETVTDPQTVLERAAAVDCVVSDYRMPGLNGLELHEALADEGVDVGFVLFTAAAEDELGTPFAETGIDAFVRKGTGTDHFDRLAVAIRETVE